MAIEPSTITAEAPGAGGASPPLISVVIPHYNDLANLERCMRLLAAQTLPHSQFEIVVADNNSRCGLPEVERVCGDLARVILAPVQGAGTARNAGVEASRGRILAFIDSDCRPSPTWLEHGLAALANAEIVGGRVDVDYQRPDSPTGVEAFERVFAFNFKRYIEEVGFAGSGNMFVPREIFEAVGGFRGQVAEDVDWGRRAVAANYRWGYADDAVVSHPARRDWAGLVQKSRKGAAEAFAATIEKPNGRVIWFMRSFAILGSPFVHWIAVARSAKLDTAEQRAKAIGVLFRIRIWRFIEYNRLLLRR